MSEPSVGGRGVEACAAAAVAVAASRPAVTVAASRPWPRVRPHPAAFAITALGAFLVSLDLSIANAVMPAIGRSFPGISRTLLSWVISAYAIAFAAALVPAGRLADRAGRRRIFAAGLAVFALGSAVCGLAPSFPILLAGRVIQALGAAAAQPASLGLLLAATDGRGRATYTGRWGGTGALGIGLGPSLGGAITALASWRWAFLVNLPLIAVALAAAPAYLGETARHPGRRLPDPAGALLLAVAAALLTLGVSEGTSWGWLSARTAAAIAAGLALGASFARRCAAIADPLLDLELLRNRRFALVTVVTVTYSAGFFGLLFSFVLFLTGPWHLSLVSAGLALTPMPVVVVLLSTRVGALADRVGFRPPLAAGAGLMAIGLLLSAALDRGHAFAAPWMPLAALIGLGIGLCYPLLSAAAISGLPRAELAAATAVNQCARQLGGALGVAACVAAMGPTESTPLARFHHAWLVCAGFCTLAALAAAAIGGRRS